MINKPLFGQPIEPGEPKYSAAFLAFWDVSTKRGSKAAAFKVWRKLNPSIPLQVKINSGMSAWMQSEQWQDETRQPHVSTWLGHNRRGWEEIVPQRSRWTAADNFGRPVFGLHTEHACNFCDPPHVWPCKIRDCDLSYDIACPVYCAKDLLKSVKL